MKQYLSKYWFFLGMAAVILAAFVEPGGTAFLKRFYILKIFVFMTFFLAAVGMDAREIFHHIRSFRPLLAGIVSCYVFIPILALGLGKLMFAGNAELLTGICILAVLPVTVASGVVLTTIARGAVSLSLLINVVTNSLAIAVVPLVLSFLLRYQGTIDLNVAAMVTNLFWTILAPTLLGQVLRGKLKEWANRYKKPSALFAQIGVLLIIYSGVADSMGRLRELGWRILPFLGFAVLLHFIVLALNAVLSRLLRLERPDRIAFILQVSQKSLAIGYIVWAGGFAELFPLALLPTIAYHMTQLIFDSVLAHRFAAKASV